MKRIALLAALLIACFAVAARATTIGVSFAADGGDCDATLAPSCTIAVAERSGSAIKDLYR